MPMPQPKRVGTPMLFSAGDEEAFTEAFNNYYSSLCFFARRLLKDEQAAKDLVADVFEKFWKKKGSYETSTHIKAWLYITTKNACYNYIKSDKRRNSALNKKPVSDEAEDYVLNRIIKAEVMREVFMLLETLPPECQKIMKLSFRNAYSNEQIAEMLSLSIHTVKNQKTRGLMLIRKQLEKRKLFGLLVLLTFFWP